MICGLGSIGQQHLHNLLTLGETDIIAYRKRNKPLSNINKNIPVYKHLEAALAQKPDVALITNPSALHISLAIKLAEFGCHLFIEKPLATNVLGVSDLAKMVKKKKIKVFVGFMMRFHPAVIQIKKWLNSNVIGNVICCQFNCSEYLPIWHNNEDYRTGYAALKSLGGGPINTLCHEFDLLAYFFGIPKEVFCYMSRDSSLKVTTEHAVEVLLKFNAGLLAEVHLDYLQNPPQRYWQIIGDKGKIIFDYYQNKLTLYTFKSQGLDYYKKEINYSKLFVRNDMFRAELQNFITSIKNNKKPKISIDDGINNLKIILAAHKSIKLKKIINIKEIIF